MRTHSANELIYSASILASDGATVVATADCGVEDLSGRRLEQAQLVSAETSHLLVMRAVDAAPIVPAVSYVSCGGVLYLVDYVQDPRRPRPGMWSEVYCHVERSGN